MHINALTTSQKEPEEEKEEEVEAGREAEKALEKKCVIIVMAFMSSLHGLPF